LLFFKLSRLRRHPERSEGSLYLLLLLLVFYLSSDLALVSQLSRRCSMNWFKQLITRNRIYSDLSEEIEQHLAEKVESLMALGMSRPQAEQAARREFGNVTRVNEQGREIWMWTRIERTFADVTLAMRKLRKSPGFTITAILTLALGIGANVVVFSVLNGLILRPLDVPKPEALFQIIGGKGREGWTAQSYRDYLDYRNRDSSFDGLMAYQIQRVGLSVGKSTTRSFGYAASGNYFDVLSIKPVIGRFFHATDEHGPASAPFIVISYDFWKRQFNGSPNVIGQTVQLNQHPFTIIGVSPEYFHGTDDFLWPDYWFPLLNATQVTGNDDLSWRDHYAFNVMGRLKSGVRPQQATDSLNALTAQMAKEDKKDDGLSAAVILAGPQGQPDNPMKKALLGIMLLALLVLLAACVNLASIFAARAADRSGELAIRMAIGSTRWHILRQLLTEAVLISIAGGMVGTFFAWLLLRALSHWQIFGDFPVRFLVSPDHRVYVAAMALSIVSGLLFGLLPARQVWNTDVLQTIKTGTLQSETFRRFAFRDILLVVQIAVCTLLVTTSLVAVRGMKRTLQIPLGFRPQNVTLAQADLLMAGYSGEQAVPLLKRMIEAASAIPGVTAAAGSDSVPFQGGMGWFVYRWGTTEFIPSHMAFSARNYLISPGYLQAAGTRLMAGRNFTWQDDKNSPAVAIVNETFARKLFGNQSAIGQHFMNWATATYEVVGVVEDGKYGSLVEDPQPAMFFPVTQGPGGYLPTRTIVMVRSQLPQDQITAELRKAVTAIEPNVPYTIAPWDDAIYRSMVPARAATVVLSIMGMLAAMLAVTGIFGMASYSVSKRLKEQGIRIALGAQHRQVMRSTLGKPVMLLFIGSALGLVLGVFASSLMSHLVAYATPHDPLILTGVFITMLFLGVLATFVPARRTLAIDPAQLLRE
jgi:predicted permease